MFFNQRSEIGSGSIWFGVYGAGEDDWYDICVEDGGFVSGEGVRDVIPNCIRNQTATLHVSSKYS